MAKLTTDTTAFHNQFEKKSDSYQTTQKGHAAPGI
jgi:hypothetical protein